MTARFQVGHGWSRSGMYRNRARFRLLLRSRIKKLLSDEKKIEWRRVGTEEWSSNETAWGAAGDIIAAAMKKPVAATFEVNRTRRMGPRLTVWKYVAEPPSSGSIPLAAKLTPGTRRTLRFHEEISLVVPNERNLGLYAPRPIKSDIPPGWNTGDPWPKGAYASAHAWAAARDAGADNVQGTGFSEDPTRRTAALHDVTAYVLANFLRLGVDQHIYNRAQWNADANGNAVTSHYGGSDPHDTHTHTGFADHDGAKPPWL